MMMTSCPAESDARENVSAFVADSKVGSLGGLRSDGLGFLKDLVVSELMKQEPGSRIIELDRDYLSDNGIDFARDLRKVMDRETSSDGKVNWIVMQDVPVMDWQTSLDVLAGRDSQVYLFSNACRQVPCCFKLVDRSSRRPPSSSEGRCRTRPPSMRLPVPDP